MATAGAKLTGDKKLIQKLRELGKKSVGINRRAINLATTPILQAVKAACPVEHGDLKKSMIKKVWNRGEVADGIVGADTSYVVGAASGEKLQLGATKKESNAIIAAASEDGGVIRPSKYDHLVEFGHATKGGGQVAAQPFMRNGWDSSISEARAKYEEELKNGLEKAAEK
jgi:HK97 gp10 family phage protein